MSTTGFFTPAAINFNNVVSGLQIFIYFSSKSSLGYYCISYRMACCQHVLWL
eukprot:SAG31_NODE_47976_length_203_cov_13.269231_1_plen_51_part_01